jgi:hypothetical protein
MIETPLALLPLACDIQETCDWLELSALSSEFQSASFSDLSRLWDKRRNTEDADFENTNSLSADGFLEALYQAVRDRINYLGTSYPFRFSDNDEELVFEAQTLNDGGVVYVFCLFIANARNDIIFTDDTFFGINNHVRDLFQACATWAAAGVVDGNAYAFGFPRLDHSAFLPKLTAIYRHFSEGKVRAAPLPGVSVNPKDEQMDVIAWKPRRDNAAGTHYLS